MWALDMTGLIEALTVIGRRFAQLIWKCVTCKPISIFGLCLILTFLLNVVYSPVTLSSLIATYISGAIPVFGVLSFILSG